MGHRDHMQSKPRLSKEGSGWHQDLSRPWLKASLGQVGGVRVKATRPHLTCTQEQHPHQWLDTSCPGMEMVIRYLKRNLPGDTVDRGEPGWWCP